MTSCLHHRTNFLLLRSCELMNSRGGSRLEAALQTRSMQSESKRDDDRRTLFKGGNPPSSLPSEPPACSKRLVGRQTRRYVWLAKVENYPQKLEEGEPPIHPTILPAY